MRTTTVTLLLVSLLECQALFYIVEENKKVYDYLFGDEKNAAALATFPLCYDDGTNATGESGLMNITFSEYRKKVRVSNSSFINMKFYAKIFQVTEVSERDQSVTIIMGMDIVWADCRLSWADHESSAKYIDLPPQKFRDLGIFFPTILFLESTEPTAGKESETKVSISRAGKVWVSSEFSTVMSCDINVRMYPFDTQLCVMTFESAYNSEVIRLVDGLVGDPVMVQSKFLLGNGRFIPSDTWDVALLPAKHSRRRNCIEKRNPNYDSPACYTDSLQFQLVLQRHPTYQIVNLMIPAFMVVIISSCVFVIPPGSGDKMGLSVTILLSMLVFTQLMYDKMPETGSSLPLLSEFFMVCVALVSGSCLYSAVSAVLANATTPVPMGLQKIVKTLGPWLLAEMMRAPHDKNSKAATNGGDKVQANAESGDDDYEENKNVGMHIDADHQVNWHATAALIDRIFFIIHILASLFTLIGFITWGYTAWSNDISRILTSEEKAFVEAQQIIQERE